MASVVAGLVCIGAANNVLIDKIHVQTTANKQSNAIAKSLSS